MKPNSLQNDTQLPTLWNHVHVQKGPCFDDPNATTISLLEFLVYLKVSLTPVSRATKSEVLSNVAKTLEEHIAVERPECSIGQEPAVYPIPPIVELTIGSHIPISEELRDELIAKFLEALEPVIRLEVDPIDLTEEFAE